MNFGWVFVSWLVAAIVLGAFGPQLRPPIPQLIIAALTAVLLTAWRLSRDFRQWVERIGPRSLVGIHLTRLVGLYFLVLCRRGELPCTFAISAGWGDLAVAISAAVLLVCWNRLASSRAWLIGWNMFGLSDILFVVASAAKHGIADPASMADLLRLPLSLLPTFLVPIIIASHIVLFVILRQRRSVTIRR